MIKTQYAICAKVTNDDEQLFYRFANEVLKMADLYVDVEDARVLEYDNSVSVVLNSHTVALVVEKEIEDIANLYGVSIIW